MELDFATLTSSERYAFLTSVVVPRPIAWITTLNEAGQLNAAPFSFYNVFGSKPGMVVLGIGNRPDTNGPKDTVLNIRSGGEFVINTVTETLARQMVETSRALAHGADELAAVGLTTEPSAHVAPPRIAESPVALECKHLATHEIAGNRLIIGEILHAAISDDYFDSNTGKVDTEALQIVGRMQGADGYIAATKGLFTIPRP